MSAPPSRTPRVAVIGGGATGCAVARDLALRGCAVTLVEFGDLGSGTSSRFHGMLQSGARYAVSDTRYAAECMRERRTVAAIAPAAVEETGGLFVGLPEDPPDYATRFAAGCAEAGIPVREVDPGRVMREEPALSRRIVCAFAVPDATIHPWRLVNLLADDVRRHGGVVLDRHRVTGLACTGGRITAVRVAPAGGGARRLEVDAVVNAAGPWAGRMAALAGGAIELELTKGSILVLAHRLVQRAVNRCRPPSSHDIVVPTGTVSLWGTTSRVVDDPDTTHVEPAEIQELLDGAEALLPGVRNIRALRAWAGVRPLVKPASWPSDRPVPRRHAVVDHAEQGIEGLFSVAGGSLSTHRAMAEDVVNRACGRLGVNRPCTTAEVPLGADGAAGTTVSGWRPAAAYEALERAGAAAKPLCDCEAVDGAALEALPEQGARNMHDVRRRLRVGFGPCQGTFCGARLADRLAAAEADGDPAGALARFWTERLKGAVHAAWGEQARQLLLSDTVHRGTLGLRLDPDVLPREDRR
jgi:glycerol-3-phosphate dehydrogenase